MIDEKTPFLEIIEGDFLFWGFGSGEMAIKPDLEIINDRDNAQVKGQAVIDLELSAI